MRLDILDLTGYRCRQHACEFGAKGKTDCRSCNAFTELLDRYGYEPEKFCMECDLRPQQDNKSCVICATHLAMQEVNIRNAITIEQAPIAQLHHILALRISDGRLLKEKEMRDETQIER